MVKGGVVVVVVVAVEVVDVVEVVEVVKVVVVKGLVVVVGTVVGAKVVLLPGLSGLIMVLLSQITSSHTLHQLLTTSHQSPGAHSRLIGSPREQR